MRFLHTSIIYFIIARYSRSITVVSDILPIDAIDIDYFLIKFGLEFNF